VFVAGAYWAGSPRAREESRAPCNGEAMEANALVALAKAEAVK
jgi:hypothetical protein